MGKKEKRRYGSAKSVAEQRSSGANYGYLKLPKDVKVFNPEPDTVAVLDILPYEVSDSNHMDRIEVGTIWYKKPFKVHKNVGPSDDSYVCLTTFGKPCPICDHGKELKENEGDEKAIDKTKAKYRNIYAVKVLSYDGKKKFDPKAIHIFDFSDFLFQEVFETQLKKKDAFDTFFLPEEGMSLEVTFDEGSFAGHKFAKVTRVDFVKRDKQYKEDIIDEVPNLDTDVLNVLSYEELEAKFFGDDVPETSDEKPSKKDKKKKKSKDAEPEPEEEPKKGKKSKKEKEPEPEVEEPKKKDKKKKKEKVKVLTGEEIIESAETLVDLLQVIETYPSTFADYAKKLKKIDKFKKLKKKMLAIAEETPFSITDDLPF